MNKMMNRKVVLSILTSVLLLAVIIVGTNIVKGDEEIAPGSEGAAAIASAVKMNEKQLESKDKINLENEKQEAKDKNETKDKDKTKDKEVKVKEKPEKKSKSTEVTKKGNEKKDSKSKDKKVEKQETVKTKEKVKKPVAEIIKEVKQGKWGSGSDRKNRLTAAGYDYSEIQLEINKEAAAAQKAAQEAAQKENKSTQKASSGQKKASAAQPSASYKANHIYVNDSGMPIRSTSMGSLQQVIDDTTYTWISLGNYNPSDNKGTYFGMHSHTGGSVIYGLGKGNEVIVTDSSGNPHVYVVGKVYVQNKQTKFDDELSGNLNQEYIVLQTSEPRVNGQRNGNRHVIAYKK